MPPSTPSREHGGTSLLSNAAFVDLFVFFVFFVVQKTERLRLALPRYARQPPGLPCHACSLSCSSRPPCPAAPPRGASAARRRASSPPPARGLRSPARAGAPSSACYRSTTRSSHNPNALASPGDVVLDNGRVTVVIDALDHPHYVAPTGGKLLDLVSASATTTRSHVFQAVGLLPGDSVAYERMTIDEDDELAAVQVHGTLAGFPDVRVVTRYEIRPCEPGVRVRTEIVNRSAEPRVWTFVDAWYWSGREALPFAPGPGRGFDQPGIVSPVADVVGARALHGRRARTPIPPPPTSRSRATSRRCRASTASKSPPWAWPRGWSRRAATRSSSASSAWSTDAQSARRPTSRSSSGASSSTRRGWSSRAWCAPPTARRSATRCAPRC